MPLYLGLDCSTQSFTALIIDTDTGTVVAKESVHFGTDLAEFQSPNGVLPNHDPSIQHSDPLMWCAGLDLVLEKLKGKGAPLGQVQAVSGSGQQHGSVYLKASFPTILANLDPTQSLAQQLKPALSLPTSPIWMDSSTGDECQELTLAVGRERLQQDTGSPAIERFTGPQIRKLYKRQPDIYHATSHIQLVSSFLCSLLAGQVAPIDYGDGAGMNLLNLKTLTWDPEIAKAITAPNDNTLLDKLPPAVASSHTVGTMAPYFCTKYGFAPATICIAWSGDNPNSLVGTGASTPGTAVISLGTSDTLFAAMQSPITDPQGYGHVFGNPAAASATTTTEGEGGTGFMSLICFTNGSLARQAVKDQCQMDSWEEFDKASFDTTPPGNNGNLMLPYFVPECTPHVPKAGVKYNGDDAFRNGTCPAASKVRAIVESQMLSIRHHSQWIAHENPFQVIRLTGGGSKSPGIQQVIADVFQARVELISISDSAALGAAMRAANAAGSIPWESLYQQFARAITTVWPNPEAADLYNRAVLQYAELERVDLQSHLLLNKGLVIEVQEGVMGRLAVATKTFDTLYEVILREKPLLTWKVGDMEDFLMLFQSAPQETQTIILDMYHPPLDADAAASSPSLAKLKKMAIKLAESITTTMDVDTIHKLLAICATNAHQYCSGKTVRQEHSAIFSYASKMAHSCTPNLAYTSVRSDDNDGDDDDNSYGALEYKVIRSIPCGSPATFSYIGGGKALYQTPTYKRREKLLQTKSFWCKCPRCSGPDYCRSVQCTTASCGSVVPCIYQDDDDDGGGRCKAMWTCQSCGVEHNSDDNELKEKQLADRLEALLQRDEEIHSDKKIQQLQDLIQDAKRLLSPVHHITVKALETLAQWSASTENPKIAAEAGLQVVLACECVAAGCPGCFDSSLFSSEGTTSSATASDSMFAHEPIYEMGVTVFQTTKDLMRVPQASRSIHSVALVQRYLPVMSQMATKSATATSISMDTSTTKFTARTMSTPPKYDYEQHFHIQQHMVAIGIPQAHLQAAALLQQPNRPSSSTASTSSGTNTSTEQRPQDAALVSATRVMMNEDENDDDDEDEKSSHQDNQEEGIELVPVVPTASTVDFDEDMESVQPQARPPQSTNNNNNNNNTHPAGPMVLVHATPSRVEDSAWDVVATGKGRCFVLVFLLVIVVAVAGIFWAATGGFREDPNNNTDSDSNNTQSNVTAGSNATDSTVPTGDATSPGTMIVDLIYPTEQPTTAPTTASPTTLAPTLAPTTTIEGRLFPLLRNSTLESLPNWNSPQSQALRWLQQTTPLSIFDNYTDWRLVQRFSLATLYYSTNGSGWKSSRFWLSPTVDECRWWSFLSIAGAATTAGIQNTPVCNDEGQYQAIFLSVNGLRGKIPPELALLTELRQIRMAADAFGASDEAKKSRFLIGPVPSELGLLSNLVHLDISSNALSSSLPAELFGPHLASSLQSMYLYENFFTGTFPTRLTQLTRLEALRIQTNKLSGPLPSELGALSSASLLEIMAANNQLYRALPSELGLLSKLTSLDLAGNQISTIPVEIGRMRSLEFLYMSDNRLVGALISEMGQLREIKQLFLDHNQLTGTISTFVGDITNVKNIDLSHNQLSGTIPTELAKLNSVNRIDLQQNKLEGGVPGIVCARKGVNPLFFKVFVDCNEVECDCDCCNCDCEGTLNIP